MMILLTMLAQVFHHPSQYPRHPVIHQTPLLQLGKGHSKLLVGFNCPGPQHWNLHHLLHVLFYQRCCLVVLQEEELILDGSQRNCGQRPRVVVVASIMSRRGDDAPTPPLILRTLCSHTLVH